MPTRLPLPTLLSHLMVAFTIECDNEFEHLAPHRTTRNKSSAKGKTGPWLASLVMYLNCLQFVSHEGVTVRQLEKLSRTKTNLNGMERWRYIDIAPAETDQRAKPPQADWLIRLTPKGRLAQQIWQPIPKLVEERWQARFGSSTISHLRQTLQTVLVQIPIDLPDCLPILHYGLFSRLQAIETRTSELPADVPLATLLSRVLLSFALDYEQESNLSLAISANVLRILTEDGVRLRDLPILSGVSKEGIQMALGVLEKRGLARAVSAEESRAKLVRLTPNGAKAQANSLRLIGALEDRWVKHYGQKAIRSLRNSIEQIVLNPVFLDGLKPYPDGWRAAIRPPQTLPHFPLVLHRGGYPDGS